MSNAPRRSSSPPDPKEVARRSLVERALGVITEVRAGEGGTALLMTLNVFLLLTAYYLIKPVREGLIGSVKHGPEYKSYMGGAVALALFAIVPLYGMLAARLKRNVLISSVSLFFVANLVGFWMLGRLPWVATETGATVYALAFLLWVGVFNLMIVAQFWAFAADVYTDEQGKRLFALIGLGASVGAVMGSLVMNRVVTELGTEHMMLVAAVTLALATAVTLLIHRRESRRPRAPDPEKERKQREEKEAKQSSQGAFSLVLHDRYLLLIAAFTVLFQIVNTNGEFILSSLVADASRAVTETREEQKAWIASYYGSFFLWVNIAGVAIQTFLVSRIVKWGGLKVGLLIFPVVALISEAAIAVVPVLLLVRIGKTAENSLDYSLNNTLRNALWLPTTTRAKYVAKQAIDSFVSRVGDMGSALAIFILIDALHLTVRAVATLNACLVLAWIYVSIEIVRENGKLTEDAKGKALSRLEAAGASA
ncbi:MAG: MFS transporter [Polyangiaceae bacterium]